MVYLKWQVSSNAWRRIFALGLVLTSGLVFIIPQALQAEEINQLKLDFKKLPSAFDMNSMGLAIVDHHLLGASQYRLMSAPLDALTQENQGLIWSSSETDDVHFLDLMTLDTAAGPEFFGVTSEGSIFRKLKTTQGKTWTLNRVWPPIGVKDEHFMPSPLFKLHAIDGQRLMAVGAFGQVLWSEDFGFNWQDISQTLDNPDGAHFYAITQSQTHLIIAGEFGLVFRKPINELSKQNSKHNSKQTAWQKVQVASANAFTSLEQNQSTSLVFDLKGQWFSIDWQSQDDEPQVSQARKLCGETLPLASFKFSESQIWLFGKGGQMTALDLDQKNCAAINLPVETVHDVKIYEDTLFILGSKGLTHEKIQGLIERLNQKDTTPW